LIQSRVDHTLLGQEAPKGSTRSYEKDNKTSCDLLLHHICDLMYYIYIKMESMMKIWVALNASMILMILGLRSVLIVGGHHLKCLTINLLLNILKGTRIYVLKIGLRIWVFVVF